MVKEKEVEGYGRRRNGNMVPQLCDCRPYGKGRVFFSFFPVFKGLSLSVKNNVVLDVSTNIHITNFVTETES